MTKVLVPIFSDHLSHTLSALEASDPSETVVQMMEVRHEADVVPHHRMKLAFIFSTMRHFAEELREAGWTVDYVELDASSNTGHFSGEMARAVERHKPDLIRVTEPSEYRVLETVRNWENDFGIPVSIVRDDRFICTHEEFDAWASDRKTLRMEYFYREMRRKTGLLMDGTKPEGGQWNFDKNNRKRLGNDEEVDPHYQRQPDNMTQAVLKMVEREFPDRFGKLDGFFYATDRDGALDSLEHFATKLLPKFGDYQDAMVKGQAFLYHSLLSSYINAGLLTPLEVCRRVEKAYKAGTVPINAAEGYIRQIIGWREYVRGIYWRFMPEYIERNYLDATRHLPTFYWDGSETDMHCLQETVAMTEANAYAHHIQRLMVTGNFALLAGVDPKEVHEWYLAVYSDAYEWVELPNTLGMSQFADGGLLGSKPYASSGNYINKMSDYCKTCRYNVKERTGEDACPFNSLYWNFMDRNRDKLESNGRLNFVYKTLDRFSKEERKAINDRAETFLDGLKTAPVSDYI